MKPESYQVGAAPGPARTSLYRATKCEGPSVGRGWVNGLAAYIRSTLVSTALYGYGHEYRRLTSPS